MSVRGVVIDSAGDSGGTIRTPVLAVEEIHLARLAGWKDDYINTGLRPVAVWIVVAFSVICHFSDSIPQQ